jgi:GT2 family glycosyltransferase
MSSLPDVTPAPVADRNRAVTPAVTAVIVTYKQNELTLAAIASLKRQTVPVSQIVVIDNDIEASARPPIEAQHPDVELIVADNPGYAPACNLGAARATGDWLFFLNPDAEADPDCLERLLEVRAAHPQAAIVTPQVLFPDHARINAGENEIHLTGIAWCGRFEEPVEDAPPRPVFITTGAAMLVERAHYERVEGYCDDFFLYYEDPDICWRTWIVGREVWYVPRAQVIHHYTWGSSTRKWYWLERHRWQSVLTNYQLSTLAVLAPMMLATEAALWVVAGREGWRPEKRRAYQSVWQRRGWIRARRARLATMRVRSDAEIVPRFRATVDSPQIESPIARQVAPLLRAYHRFAVAAVRALAS